MKKVYVATDYREQFSVHCSVQQTGNAPLVRRRSRFRREDLIGFGREYLSALPEPHKILTPQNKPPLKSLPARSRKTK